MIILVFILEYFLSFFIVIILVFNLVVCLINMFRVFVIYKNCNNIMFYLKIVNRYLVICMW